MKIFPTTRGNYVICEYAGKTFILARTTAQELKHAFAPELEEITPNAAIIDRKRQGRILGPDESYTNIISAKIDNGSGIIFLEDGTRISVALEDLKALLNAKSL